MLNEGREKTRTEGRDKREARRKINDNEGKNEPQ